MHAFHQPQHHHSKPTHQTHAIGLAPSPYYTQPTSQLPSKPTRLMESHNFSASPHTIWPPSSPSSATTTTANNHTPPRNNQHSTQNHYYQPHTIHPTSTSLPLPPKKHPISNLPLPPAAIFLIFRIFLYSTINPAPLPTKSKRIGQTRKRATSPKPFTFAIPPHKPLLLPSAATTTCLRRRRRRHADAATAVGATSTFLSLNQATQRPKRQSSPGSRPSHTPS